MSQIVYAINVIVAVHSVKSFLIPSILNIFILIIY